MDVGLMAEVGFSRGQRRVSLALSAPSGGISVLVGPSGSGKTTLLRLLAGLNRPDNGYIRVRDLTWFDHVTGVDLAPQQRRVGMVFQDYALFPHMSALDNVAFARRGLEERRKARQAAARLLGKVHMEGLAQRRPRELSGGQKQRVAVARALAREPALLLLDEPFSAVDQVVRRKLREELLELTESLQCAVVMVTHDLQEAAMLGQQVGVMHRGRLLQLGAREEVFYRPSDVQAARLLDMRNILPAEVVSVNNGETLVHWAGRTLVAHPPRRYRVGEMVWAGVRPEHVLVVRREAPTRRNEVSGTVSKMLYLGGQVHVTFRPDDKGQELSLEFSEHLLPRFRVEVGRSLRASLWHERLHLMPRGDDNA